MFLKGQPCFESILASKVIAEDGQVKGLVFTEFMQMAEERFGADMVDVLIAATSPASEGAYTSVGTYDFLELVNYFVELEKQTGISIEKLLFDFGNHLAATFVVKFPDFFSSADDLFSFLKKIDDHIHVEVRKLYPDAELPEFNYVQEGGTTLKLFYRSSRNLADLAHGLISACAIHFKEDVEITRKSYREDGMDVEEFVLVRSLPGK